MKHQRIKVVIGEKIREWTIIEINKNYIGKGSQYICECKCGRRLSKFICELKRIGPTQCKSCATKARNFGKYGHPLKDLTGMIFGKWTVLNRCFNGKSKGYWECLCECGNKNIVFGGELRRGKSTKCKICVDHRHFTHGMGTKGNIFPEYRSWSQMKTRCFNSKIKRYSQWGGRGITMYPEWIDSFEKFYEYIGPKPTPQHSIDRINNDGNYEPGNVRWATKKEQANNRRKRK